MLLTFNIKTRGLSRENQSYLHKQRYVETDLNHKNQSLLCIDIGYYQHLLFLLARGKL